MEIANEYRMLVMPAIAGVFGVVFLFVLMILERRERRRHGHSK